MLETGGCEICAVSLDDGTAVCLGACVRACALVHGGGVGGLPLGGSGVGCKGKF
jgi:hypothetical protein